MKKRTFTAILLSLVLALSTSCNVQTKPAGSTVTSTGNQEAVTIRLLTQSNTEKIANVVRDQLVKAGFNVVLNTQADASSYKEQKANGNYDIDIASWMTVTGNPDYSVRTVFYTEGDNNINKLSDTKIDTLIDKASEQTAKEYVATYSELEKYMVDEMAYITPLYASLSSRAVDKTKIKPESIEFFYRWDNIQYVDASKYDTIPYYVTQNSDTFSTWDPIRANDSAVGTIMVNLYTNLINTTEDYEITTDASLSRNYAIADGNQDYYFLLRDDINFARVSADRGAIDSGVMVSAEDVVYSVNRMKDPDSIPMHRTYSLFESINTVEIVTDISELDSVQLSDGSGSIRTALEAGISTPIITLTASRNEVDNSAGSYQVVKIKTNKPFPQVLNYLAHHAGGIVDSEWIEAINSKVDIATYDANSDTLYGDVAGVREGSSYANTLSCSGPYVLTYMNDYEVVCERNPAFMTEVDNGTYIKTIVTKPMTDLDAGLSALRSGDIDYMAGVPESSHSIVADDPRLELLTKSGSCVYYISFNTREGSVCSDVLLRKAVSACINQEEINAAFNGKAVYVYSTLSAVLDTGNKFVFETGKAQEYLAEYFANK